MSGSGGGEVNLKSDIQFFTSLSVNNDTCAYHYQLSDFKADMQLTWFNLLLPDAHPFL